MDKINFKFLGILILAMAFNASQVFAQDRLSIVSQTVTAGEDCEITIGLDNETIFYGFQADITLPKGLEVVTENGIPDVILSDRFDASFSVISKLHANNKLRLGAFSSDHNAIKGNSGPIFNVKLKASDSFEGGTIYVSDIICITEDNQDYKLEDTETILDYIVKPKSILFSKESIQLHVGNTIQLEATVQPENASDKNVEWSSSDETIATVDAEGNVTAISLGETTITARCGEVTASCRISVISTPAESIVLNTESAQLKVGESIVLEATVLPEDATDKTVIWSSKNNNIAIVDENGNVTAVGLGETVITARCGEATASCKISVVPTPAERIILNTESAQLKVGESIVLEATVLPEDATDKTVIWSSKNNNIAIVDENGNVTAVGLGETVITARCGEATASCRISVIPTPSGRIILNTESAQLKVGKSISLEATVLPEDATDKTVSWHSEDPNIAIVDEDGNVTARSLGETVIKARCGEATASCRILVVPTQAERIILNTESAQLKVGEGIRLEATVLPEDATDKTVTWYSENPNVATVDRNGNVTAVSLGETTITARCGEAGASCKISVVPTPAERIILNTESSELKVGESISLEATVLPEEATDKTVSWHSEDPNIAIVDEDGNVTARSLGETVITARCGEATANCRISVVPTPAERIILNTESAQLKVGENIRLEVTVLPEDATDKTVTWSAEDPNIAIVDDNGNVSAVSLGETTITARCGEVSASCRVSVISTLAESIVLNTESAQLKVGEGITLEATVLPEDATDKTIIWSSENTEIAVVDEDGNVTAHSIGETVITARCGEATANCRISVVPTPAERIILNTESAQLKVGEGIRLEATVLPEDATDKTVTWYSEDQHIATVDVNGNVSAMALGNTAIVARSGETSAICWVSVVETPAESIFLNTEFAELKVGESIALEATVLPEEATDRTVRWSSEDETIAYVDDEGNVTALGLGETYIIAHCGEATASCRISVIPTPAESIYLNTDFAELKVGESIVLEATVLPDDATDKTVTWYSEDLNIAIVDENGNVSALSLGETIITARCGEATASCRISVVPTPSERIILNTESAQLKVGEGIRLEATVLPEDATDKTVTWYSEAPNIAIVDENGYVTALALGSTAIVARSGEVEAYCWISVVETPAESIILNTESAELKVGESILLEATVLPEDATDKTVRWSSEDEAIAYVDVKGNVTALGLGETYIIASCGEATSLCKISVIPTPAESIYLNREFAELKVGESIVLEANVLPEDATDKTVTWHSEDPNIASVDENGNVTAVSLGETTITARCGEASASCKISVVPTPAERIILNTESAQLKVGESINLEATVLPEDATDKTVTWYSDNPNIASVDENGNVIAMALGGTTIVANCGGASAICWISVVETPAETIILNTESAELKVGESIALEATVQPEDATDKMVRWSSEDETIAYVDVDGNVTALSLGETYIFAHCGEATASCKISVIPTPAESIYLNTDFAELKVGESIVLEATVLPWDATDKTVIWSSENAEIAVVDEDGNVTAHSLGETVITARCGEATASCRILVVPTPAERIILNTESAQLKVGESINLEATVLPEDATDKTVTWHSEDPNIATVDAHGNVTAMALGSTAIVAHSGEAIAYCWISVVETPAETIILNTESAELKVGESITLEASVLPEDATDKTVRWSSEDYNIAYVDDYGYVTAFGLGETYVIASCGEVTASCRISVIPTPAESIYLNREFAELKVGESIVLEANVLPEDATDKTVTWHSEDPNIASVDENGNVTAVSLGETTITARCGEASASCKISVVPTPAERIILNTESAQLKVGESINLEATVLPEDATDKTVTWHSEDPNIATVDAHGNVTAMALGSTAIVARSGEAIAYCWISVVETPAESIILNTEFAELKIGEFIALEATVQPEDATDKTVRWSSENAEIAVVDEDGNVTAHSIGETVITARCGEATASCKILVVPTPAERIILNTESAQLKVGEGISLEVTVLPEDATDKTVKWYSEDPNIATVDENGNVTAISVGETVITAQCGHAFAECRIIVEPVLASMLSINPGSWDGEIGSKFQIMVTIMPENTTDKSVSFESSDTSIATVDSEGNVEIIGEGSCYITISTLDGSNLWVECYITGISDVAKIFEEASYNIDVYTTEGVLIIHNGIPDDLKLLKQGIYIVRAGSFVKRIYIK